MRYRLKKWYSDLPQQWNIGDVFEVEERYQMLRHTNMPPISYKIPVLDILKHPDCWERIGNKLLTTEDGVDIYDGDKVWFVTEKGSKGFTAKRPGTINGNRYFKEEKNADKWLDNNKPEFSRHDIDTAIENIKSEFPKLIRIRNDVFINEVIQTKENK